MSFFSSLKSKLRLSNASPVVEENPAEQETIVRSRIIPPLNRGMPVEIMKDFNSILFSGRLSEVTPRELTIERIPGELSFPICEDGSTVMVRGYDDDLNPVILSAKIIQSSIISCTVGDLESSPYVNARKSVRYPLCPPANLYALDDTRLNHPQPCQLLNISTGGACVASTFTYTMEQPLRLRVELVEKGGHTSFHCQVVRITPREENMCEYGLLFEQLDRRKLDSLSYDIQTIRKDNERKLLS